VQALKLHVGSGTVMLRGYRNIDVPTPRCYLASERPNLLERYLTDEGQYYQRHEEYAKLDAFRQGPSHDLYCCDAFGRWDCLPCRDHEAEELLSRQSFEHLGLADAHRALDEAKRVLQPGGLLRLSVPDHETTMRNFIETREVLLIRHLLGPRTSVYGFHQMSYTEDSLDRLVREHGFELLGQDANPHIYPSISLKWRRE
jgi:hypothetical protein